MMPDFLPSFHSLQGQYNSRQITTGRNRSIAPGIWNNITQNAKSIEQQVRFNVGVATHWSSMRSFENRYTEQETVRGLTARGDNHTHHDDKIRIYDQN